MLMALKRIKSEVDHRSLGHVRFWTEDLSAIVGLIEEASPGEIKITVDEDLSAAGVEDLAEYPRERLTSFVVTAPGVELVLGPNVAVLKLEQPNLAVRGMATEIERIAGSGRRRGALFGRTLRNVAASIPLALVGKLPIAQAGDVRGSAILYSRPKRDAPPWFERNKDALATNVIVSIVFYILGLLTPAIVKLIGNLFH
ncbi:hypothetical protein Ate01nite_67770 [Actinoplanes teichomyceticus]|nr:hypothetical protein Ate01nite_67770 [Actinoplanes teichomyceticus]